MAYQSLDCLEIIPVIQEGGGKGVPHDVGMNPLLDQSLFYPRFDEAVNSFLGQVPFLIWTVLPQCLE
jgi:hypothetical protein